MGKQLLRERANMHVRIIGIFYIISGIWEYLHGFQGDSLAYFLVGIYHNYVVYLGLFTIVIGIGILLRRNLCRKLALILAWWNLFTAPILDQWWFIYAVKIKKIFIGSAPSLFWLWTIGIIILVSITRIYIIYMLRISKAGYIFLKEYKNDR